MSTPIILTGTIVVVALALGSVAHAADPSSAPASPSLPARASPELCVQIISGPNPLDATSVRAAIEKELGLATQSTLTPASVGTVRIESGHGSSVTISYASADGNTQLNRRIALPIDPARRATVIAWIVGNLVRNEADEILLAFLNRNQGSSGNDDPSEATTETPPVAADSMAGPAADANTQAAAPKGNVRISSGHITYPQTQSRSPRAFHAALFSPLSVPTDAPAHSFHLSLSLAYGHVGALDGVGIGCLVDRLDARSSGVQMSGLWIDHDEHRGALIAGVAARGHNRVHGLQLAGVITYAGQTLQGAQISGAANITRSGTSGLQLSGIFNHAGDDVRGTQITGAVNLTTRELRGLQLSGVFNYAGDTILGAQVTGALNLAHDVNGLQVGLVNVARDVDGLQLGVVNIAKQNRGLALGFFNWTDDARFQPIVFYQNPGYLNAGYRTVAGHSTGTISFGYDPSTERARTRFATGPRFAFGRFAVGAEFGYGWVLEHMKSSPSDRAHELELAGIASAEVVRNLVTVYGGGGLVLPVAGVVDIEPRGLIQAGIALF